MEHQIDYHEFRRKKDDEFDAGKPRKGGIGNLFLGQLIVCLLTAIILLFINIGAPDALQGLKDFFKNQVQGDKGITQTVTDALHGMTNFLTSSSGSESGSSAGTSNSSSDSGSSLSDGASGSSDSSLSLPSGVSSLAMGMGGEENPLPLFRESVGLSEVDLTPLQTDYIVPIHGKISSGYGYRTHPTTGLPDFHKGIDVPAEAGTPIGAFRDGTVIQAQWSESFGYFVSVQHDDNTITRYGHCSSLNVKVGDVVKTGDTVGFVGDTGYSTGNHCHFDISVAGVFVDPLKVLPTHMEAGYAAV